MSFNLWCAPGPASGPVVRRKPGTGQYALFLYLDPGNISLSSPPFPGGGAAFARFCRELAREAARLAGLVDPPEGKHSLVLPR